MLFIGSAGTAIGGLSRICHGGTLPESYDQGNALLPFIHAVRSVGGGSNWEIDCLHKRIECALSAIE